MNEFSRTELLLGAEGMSKLKRASVAIFGVGGVGSFAVEAIARGGVGNISIFDKDKVSITNINRQLIATRKTIGKSKVEVMRDRILDISPQVNVEAYQVFYKADNANEFDLSKFDYIIDAIDTVSSKLTLIEQAKALNIPIISCMGAGNKLDPTRFEVTDIYKTSVCPLAKVMRYELRKRGIESLKVVYSKEHPLKPIKDNGETHKDKSLPSLEKESIGGNRKQVPGSVSFVPPVAGLIIAGEVIKDILNMGDLA